MGRSNSRSRNGPCTVVIKLGELTSLTSHLINPINEVGTSSIVHEQTHQPLLSTLSSVVETVIQLKNQGHKVVLVSSGAIGVGLKRMDMPSRPKNLSGKQVCLFIRLDSCFLSQLICVTFLQALAAIGQGRLIALYDNLFGQLEQPIAQVLLTRGDISDVRCHVTDSHHHLFVLIFRG